VSTNESTKEDKMFKEGCRQASEDKSRVSRLTDVAVRMKSNVKCRHANVVKAFLFPQLRALSTTVPHREAAGLPAFFNMSRCCSSVADFLGAYKSIVQHLSRLPHSSCSFARDLDRLSLLACY
jgi:hypothetical protein